MSPYLRRPDGLGRGISLLVPFRADTEDRQLIWDWLRAYYRHHLPGAEMVVGNDDGTPFSKACAVNNAASRATGDVFVLLDADCLIGPQAIIKAASRIRLARDLGFKEWYIPYRTLYRLTQDATRFLLSCDPTEFRLLDGPLPSQIENHDGSGEGHHFAALIQIMPAEGFWAVGGMDPRMRGWGAEDVAFLLAMDTLFARHRTLDEFVVTPSHVVFGRRHHRKWVGQTEEDPNGRLGARYRRAWMQPDKMRHLVDEALGLGPNPDDDGMIIDEC